STSRNAWRNTSVYEAIWLTQNFEHPPLVGAAHSVRNACQQLGKRWSHGIRDCERYLSPPITS
ncbi:hypothetical protein OQJ62_16685, partial [Microbulbifer thermotolerans]|uniref:hypothetical protein n=1 Tax=Microbulbifer thermotolerans TaxID=252514 RepID=UPI00224969E4